MRLVRIEVEAFKAIRKTALEFGPGLNVLYGPNDLGKSTLAEAIRAALLVPPSSAEAHKYAAWSGGESPRVELVFVDAEGHHWKIRKTFSGSSSAPAELLHSKDGRTFSSDCKGRQVEERVRAKLQWGIPAPGGRGGPRGAPQSFLATALLGGQAEPEDILAANLESDDDGSGKKVLGVALAALAQDPELKRVLDAAQREVEQFFTETGKRKRSANSRFKEANERVKDLAEELEQRRQRLHASEVNERDAGALRERRARLRAALDEARAELAAAEQRLTASQRLEQAQAALRAIDAEVEAARTTEQELARSQERLRQREERARTAEEARARTQTALRAAEDELRSAQGEDATRALELRRAQLGARAAELRTMHTEAGARVTALEARLAARAEVLRTAEAESAATAALELARAASAQDEKAAKQQATELAEVRALLAFLRWRTALEAEDARAETLAAAERASVEAARKDAEAQALDRALESEAATLRARAELLPAPTRLQELVRLERELALAEAALGGGLSLVLRPAGSLDVRVQIDQEPAQDRTLAQRSSFDAERRLRLTIAGVGELDISAGRAAQRALVEGLRARWTVEVEPVLARAGVAALAALAEALGALDEERGAQAERRRQAETLRAEARALASQARVRAESAGAVRTSPASLAALAAECGSHDREALAARAHGLGTSAEARARELEKRLSNLQEERRAQRKLLDEALTRAELELETARALAEEARRAADARGPEDGEPAALLAQARHERAELQRQEAETTTQLGSLAGAAGDREARAQRALASAKEGELGAARVLEQARKEALEARSEVNRLDGALQEKRTQLAKLDRAAALAIVAARRSELDALPTASATSAQAAEHLQRRVAQASEAHERTKAELLTKEGELAHVGGAALREELQRLGEACEAARTHERELEVDAEAWKLLRDTLRAAENEEGQHLGRALAGPVGARFEALTAGRYRALRLDAGLQAEGLEVVSTSAAPGLVLGELSVGTRAQLACLIRLAVAQVLRTVVVLDDHLVHTDELRLDWFQRVLQETALETQVLVITCRPQDYLSPDLLPPDAEVVTDLAAGTIRAIDLGRALQRNELGSAASPGPAFRPA
jgi:DNA repair exonuclease SbcCD ATPase subunit